MARKYRLEQRVKKKARAKKKEERLANMTEREKKIRELLGWAMYIVLVVCATYLIVTYVGQRTKVSGNSMLPTLQNGDNLIVDKITYRFKEPERYDIIVFPYRYAEDTYYIKRIIGLPGETVQIIDGYVYINDKILKDEHYGLEIIQNPGNAKEPIVLEDDEYFVLGDNRNASADSRESSVGVLHRDEIIGKAWMRIWPLKNFGVISHE